MSILDKEKCLVLNSIYQPIGTCSIKKALIALNSTQDGENRAAKAIQIEYKQNTDGSWDFNEINYFRPVAFEEWCLIPLRSFDIPIHSPKLTIRAPTVILVVGFAKMPMKNLKPTLQNIRKRDKDICQYSNKKLTKSQISLDHILPKSRGGKDNCWTNLVICDKNINFKKGNKLNSEVGLKLIKKPKAPLPIPVSHTITEMRHRDWLLFCKS